MTEAVPLLSKSESGTGSNPAICGADPTRLVRAAAFLPALVLLAASALKVWGLNVSPFAQYGTFLTPTVQSVALAGEIVLGAWLLSGLSRFVAWLAAVVAFATFAGISGYLGIVGQSSCGCFGAIKASPWAAFTLDIAVLVLLATGKPKWTSWHYDCSLANRWCGGAAAVMVVLWLVALAFYGSTSAALAKLRNEHVSVEPGFVDLGEGKPFESRAASIDLINRTRSPIRIVGTNLGCACSLINALPLHLPPNERVTVGIRMNSPEGPGRFARIITLTTDDRVQPLVAIQVSGSVVMTD